MIQASSFKRVLYLSALFSMTSLTAFAGEGQYPAPAPVPIPAPVPVPVPAPAGGGMVEIGVGASVSPECHGGLEALFEVKVNSGNMAIAENTYFVIAKIYSGMLVGGRGVSYIDMQLDTVNFQLGEGGTFAGVSIIGADIQRDLALENNLSARVSFLGLRGGVEAGITENVEVYLRGAADLIGLGLVSVGADPYMTGDGYGYADGRLLGGGGLSGEIGLRLHKRIRIAFGEKAQAAATYVDGSGVAYPVGMTSNTYATLAVDLTQQLSVFGKVSYNVYELSPVNGSNSVLRWMFGVSHRF